MNSEAIWQAFADTGDPLCDLFYKKAEDRNTGAGDAPRPTD